MNKAPDTFPHDSDAREGPGVVDLIPIVIVVAGLLTARGGGDVAVAGVAIAAAGSLLWAAWRGVAWVTTPVFVLAGLGGWMLLTSPWAAIPGGSVVDAMRWGSLAAVTAVATGLGGRASGRRIALGAVLGGCGLITAHLAWSALAHPLDAIRSNGLLGYSNASAVTATVTGLACVRLLSSTERRWRITGAGVATTVGLAMVATTTRGALLAWAVGVTVILVHERARGQWRQSVAASALAALPTAVLLVTPLAHGRNVHIVVVLTVMVGVATLTELLAGTGGLGDTGRRASVVVLRRNLRIGAIIIAILILTTVAVSRSGSTAGISTLIGRQANANDRSAGRLFSLAGNHRGSWWGEAVHGIGDRPIAGWGGDGFIAVHARQRPDPGVVQHAHSLPLDVTVAGGLVALLLLIWGGGAAIARARRALIEPDARLAGAIVAGLTAQSLIDWTPYVPFIAVIFGMCLGIVLHDGSRDRGGGSRVRCKRALASGVVPTILALAVAVPALAICAGAWSGALLTDKHARAARSLSTVSARTVPRAGTVATAVGAIDRLSGGGAADRYLRSFLPTLRDDPTALPTVIALAHALDDNALVVAATGRLDRIDHFHGTASVPALPGRTKSSKAGAVLLDWRADGRIDGTWTRADLRAARKLASTAELEYTNLASEFDRASAQASVKPSANPIAGVAPRFRGLHLPWAVPGVLLIALLSAVAGRWQSRRRRVRRYDR